MKSRLIILVFLSFLTGNTGGQDLEEVSGEPLKKEERILTPPRNEHKTVQEERDMLLTNELTKTGKDENPDVHTVRAATTYKKEEYLNQILRQIYYQKITTNPWSKYLNQTSWEKNVLLWRYWTQLKNYMGGNNNGVIVIRSPEESDKNDLVSNEVAISKSKDGDDSVALDSYETKTPLGEVDVAELSLADKKNDEVAIKVSNEDLLQNTQGGNTRDVILDPQQKLQQEIPKEVVHTSRIKDDAISINSNYQKLPQVKENGLTRGANFVSQKGYLPWPVDKGRITDRFGIRKNAEARGLRPENYGIDMYCPGGTYVTAVSGGTILLSKRQSPYDYIVTIKHGDFTTAYYYLIIPYVKAGDVVSAGQRIGQLRTSVAEADFHFEIWQNQDRVNPETWLKNR